MQNGLRRQQRAGLALDKETGLLGNCFTVDIEDGDIVFSFGDTPFNRDAPVPMVDLSDVISRLINLVEPISGRTYIAQVRAGEDPRCLAHVADRENEYRLVDSSCEELVDLAYEIGPLFGVYDFDSGMVCGLTVREPVDWWRAAAGALSCAMRMRDAASDETYWRFMSSEVELCRAVTDELRVLKAVYISDLGFPGAYGRMIAVGESEYHRAFPAVSASDEPAGVCYRGGFESKNGVRCEPSPYPIFIRHSDWAKRRFDLYQNKKLSESSRGFVVSPRDGARSVCVRNGDSVDAIYVVRIEGGSVDYETGSDPYRFGVLPDDGDYSVFVNSILYPNPVWYKMYGNLYDVMVRIHTRRNSLDYELGRVSTEFYECALERIWCAFARQAIEGRSVACRNCGRAFVIHRGERPRQYCDANCRDSYNKKVKKEERARRIKRVIAAHLVGGSFTLSSICECIGAPGKETEVDSVMHDMERDGWTFKRRSGRYPSFTVEYSAPES